MRPSPWLVYCSLGTVVLGAFLFFDSQSPKASEFAKARRHHRAGQINEAFALYQSIEGSDPGGVWGCKAMWEEASIRYSVANQTKEVVGLLETIIGSCEDLELVGQALVLLADIYEFARLVPGNIITGPAVVHTPITTIVLQDRQIGQLDEFRNMVIEFS